MILDREKFQEGVKKNQLLIAKAARNQDKRIIIPLNKICRDLALAYSGFKCQKCSREDKLTWHHLIMRPTKNFVDFWRYISMRNYWNNIFILCPDCHKEIHKIYNEDPDFMGYISQEKIDKVRTKYYKKEETEDGESGTERYGFDERDGIVLVDDKSQG